MDGEQKMFEVLGRMDGWSKLDYFKEVKVDHFVFSQLIVLP